MSSAPLVFAVPDGPARRKGFAGRGVACVAVVALLLLATWTGQRHRWSLSDFRRLIQAPHFLRSGAPSFLVDLQSVNKGSDKLWGSFFEEINHAGEGGLYSELIQDRSFDALVNSLGADPPQPLLRFPRTSRLSGDPQPWSVVHGGGQTRVTLTTQVPEVTVRGRAASRRKAVKLSTSGAGGGVANAGFWGIPLTAGRSYQLSLWAAAWGESVDPNAPSPQNCPASAAKPWSLDVKLLRAEPGNGTRELAAASFKLSCAWTKFSAVLTPDATADAVLSVTASQPSDVLLDHISLMPIWSDDERAALLPQSGGDVGASSLQPWPFRPDLFKLLSNLRPRFLRFPGGCFVEGDRLQNAVHWKDTVGFVEARPGHWNLWGYWSSDGLGLYEYLLLAEALGASPVWVANSGMSHSEQVPPAAVLPWIQDTLDGLEFILGPADSHWGSLRAFMGHPEPFSLQYIAVGNEDAGMPHYLETYLMFWAALKTRHPNLKLIANDELKPVGVVPNDIWDYHVYTDPPTLFSLSTAFDGVDRARSKIFVSEFAVTGGGGKGNVIGAIAEAAFMTGLERNADQVELASYAPLFVNENDRRWSPDMIVFDGRTAYGTPSYWIAHLFSSSYHPFVPRVAAAGPSDALVRASAVCTTAACTTVNVRIVSMQASAVTVQIQLMSSSGFPEARVLEHTVLKGSPNAENNLTHPTADDAFTAWLLLPHLG